MLVETTCFSDFREWNWEDLTSGKKKLVRDSTQIDDDSVTLWFGLEDSKLPDELLISLFALYSFETGNIAVGHSIGLHSDQDQNLFSMEELIASDFDNPSQDASANYILEIIGANLDRLRSRINDLEYHLLNRVRRFMQDDAENFVREKGKVLEAVSQAPVVDKMREIASILVEKGLPFSSEFSWGSGLLATRAEVRVPVTIGDPCSDYFQRIQSNSINLPFSELYASYLADKGLSFNYPWSNAYFWFKISTSSFEEFPESSIWNLSLQFDLRKELSDCQKEIFIDFLTTLINPESKHLDHMFHLLDTKK